MRFKLFFFASFISYFSICNGQVQWTANGNNIYSPNSGNVGVGTSLPQAKLHVNVANPDNLGLIIQGNSINTDGKMHYTGLSIDGDYGNGTGNSSQIRSYSNLYNNWGSSLTFHTTTYGAHNLAERMRIDEYGNVGIGQPNPQAKLDIAGAIRVNYANPAQNIFQVDDNVNYGLVVRPDLKVGIGTNLPNTKLDVTSSLSTDRISIKSTNTTANVGFMISNADNTERWSIATKYDLDYLQIFKAGLGNVMVFKDNGNVGIGTNTPGNYKLNVWGKIRAHEIVVNTDGADFVFDPTYKLRPLSELETFIKENKHLPEIAPAKEMQENGVSAGEMQTKLLQKVEEATLYIIDLQNQVNALKKENEQLREEKLEQQAEQLQMLMELKKEVELLKHHNQ